MFSLTSSAEIARLEVAHAPLDGRTIRPSHLDDIWEVFGISGNPFPSSIHRILLETIANNRNNVAHGIERPAVVGAMLTYDDALRHALKVEDMLEHVVIASERYISLSNYRR